MNALESFERKLQQDLGAIVIGMDAVIRALAIAVVARGHVLLQGAPGLGKTLLSKALAGCARRCLQAGAGNVGPDAVRHHRRARLRHRAPRVRVSSWAGVRRRAAGGRDQSHRTEDAVGAARGDGRAAGDDRPAELSLAGQIPGRRHPEPARVRGHVSAAGIAARPFHAAHRPQLSGAASTSWRSSRGTATPMRTLASTSRRPRAPPWRRHRARSRECMSRRSCARTWSISQRLRASTRM